MITASQMRSTYVGGDMGGKMIALGLDYAGVKAGLKLAQIKLTPKEFDDLRVIERAAVARMNGVGL